MTNPELTRVTDRWTAGDPAVPTDAASLDGLVGDLLAEDASTPREEGTSDGGDPVADALVEAGRTLIESFGIRRLRMDDVARQAGYGRATLYRRFATRDELVWAVITREIRRTLLEIADRTAPIPDLRDRIVEAFAVTLEEVRANPLVRRLLQIEPDLLLPHLTTGGSGALAIGRQLMVQLLEEGRSRGELRHIDVPITADLLVRVAHSMLLTPDGPVAIDDPQALRAFARTFLADPVFRAAPPDPTHA